MHLKGVGTPRSCPNSLIYLRAAGEFGEWGGVLREGFDAYLGRAGGALGGEGATGGVRDEGKAALLYDYGAEMGYKEAKANAAWLMDRREGNSSRAVELYRDMASHGMGEAELRLGDYRWYAGDYAESIQHWRVAAEKGVGQANYNLAFAYQYGLGVAQDFAIAQRHYVLAAERQPGGFVAGMVVQYSLWRLWAEEVFNPTALVAMGTVLLAAILAGLVACLVGGQPAAPAAVEPPPPG